MLKHTRKLINQTIDDFRSLCAFFSYTTQIIYIIYLAYLLITPTAIWYIHLALLLISLPFFIYDIISTNNINRIREEKPRFWRIFKRRKYNEVITHAKKSKTKIKRIKNYTSQILKLVVLAVSFYPIIVSPNSIHPLSIICSTFMAIMWLLSLALELVTLIVEKRFEMFEEALSADMEFITKPINAIKNTVSRIIGNDDKEDESTEARSENIADWLDARISKFRRKVGTKTNVSVENDDNNDF